MKINQLGGAVVVVHQLYCHPSASGNVCAKLLDFLGFGERQAHKVWGAWTLRVTATENTRLNSELASLCG